MKEWSIDELRSIANSLAEQLPYLKMLVLFGSRARGEQRSTSDWDFAVLYDEELRKQYETGGWDAFKLWIVLQQALKLADDKIDVVDINHCSPALSFAIARDGKLLYEREPNQFTQFRRKAWKTYADTAKFRKLRRRSIGLTLQKWGL